MSRLHVAATAAVSVMCSFGAAYAGDCKDVDSYAKKLNEAADRICTKVGDKWQKCDASKIENVRNEVQYWTSWWNEMVGETWAKIGPRHVGFGTTDKGTIVNPGTRIWVSSGPSAGDASWDIDYVEGAAGMKISYCAIDATGNVEFLGAEDVNPKKQPPKKSLDASKVAGKFLAVKLDGDGGAGKKWEYKIKLNGQLQAE
jgi:hypothetical protein